jgi:hypothetical protein
MVSYSLLIVFFINRDPCNIVTYTISIQCSPLYTSALSLSYISPIYLTWYQSHFLVAFNKCLWRFQAYVLLMLYDCLIISVAHMPPHASKMQIYWYVETLLPQPPHSPLRATGNISTSPTCHHQNSFWPNNHQKWCLGPRLVNLCILSPF